MKNFIKRIIRSIRKIRIWYLVFALLPLLVISATLLRMDNQKLSELQNDVAAADESGDRDQILASLIDLRIYVSKNIVLTSYERNGESHLAFGTGPFYLKEEYVRRANEEIERAKEEIFSDDNPNGNVFEQAAAICDPIARANGWRYPDPRYIECIMNELDKFPPSPEIDDFREIAIPALGLFRYDFASPIWAPTPTGFAILACLIIFLLIAFKIIAYIFLRLTLAVLRWRE
jgi:hypothetical protein